ncbi:type III secretion system protein [Erwinia psidii]|nr:type III secretion system protein [Erwinia psidii]
MNIPSNGRSLLDLIITGSEEANCNEIKKKNELARRFGNTAFREHIRAESVNNALNTLQPEQLLNVLQSTRNAVSGMGGNTNLEQQEIPELTQPKPVASETNGVDGDASVTKNSYEQLSLNAKLIALLGTVIELNMGSSVQKAQSELNTFNAVFKGLQTQFTQLSGELVTQGKAYTACQDNLSAMNKQAQELNGKVDKAQADLNTHQDKLNRLEAQAAGKNPIPGALQQQIDQARKAVRTAQEALNVAQNKYNSFVVGPLSQAKAALAEAKNNLQATINKSQNQIQNVTTQQLYLVESSLQQKGESERSLTYLLALMHQLIQQNSNNEMSSSLKLKQALAEAVIKDAERKDAEYKEQVRKAEDMQKTMGCIGKTLGWLITGISFAAALFTGGASLALAAVGLALAVGDEIYQAVTGESYMQKMMNPLMEKVIQPVMDFLSKVYSDLLKSFGVDNNAAELAGQIIAAVTVAVAMAAGMMVAGAAVAKLAGAVVKKVAQTAVGRVLKTLGQNISKKVMGSAANKMTKMAKIANNMEKVSTAASVVNTGLGIASNIYVAKLGVDASKILAKLIENAALMNVLNEMMESIIEIFTRKLQTLNDTFKNLTQLLEDQLKKGKYIANKMSSVAV